MNRRATRLLERLNSEMSEFTSWQLGDVVHSSMDFEDIYGYPIMVVFAPGSAFVMKHHSVERFIRSEEYWEDQFTYRAEGYRLNTPIITSTDYGGLQYADLFLSMFPFHIVNHIIACYEQYDSIVS